MDPFSHIQIVHRYREEEAEDDAGSPQTVFRRPSFSQQVQHAAMTGLQPAGVSVRGGAGGAPAARASLANLTSGTTFAAAARQAELNAARASKLKARQAERADEVPAIEPVALGSLRFTTSRRGYVVSDLEMFHWWLIQCSSCTMKGWARRLFHINGLPRTRKLTHKR